MFHNSSRSISFLTDCLSSPIEFTCDQICAVDDRMKSLRSLLRFLSRYHDSVVGWETNESSLASILPPTFATMINWRNESYLSPLLLACTLGRASAAEILIKFGADSGMIEASSRSSALILATKAGSLGCVKALLSDCIGYNLLSMITLQKPPITAYRCIPYHMDLEGKTALSLAAELGRCDIFSLLLSHGIAYHIHDFCGNSPLHLASMNGHMGICQLILDEERDKVIREIEIELGSAERMKGELERISSSFRGGLKTPCKSRLDQVCIHRHTYK